MKYLIIYDDDGDEVIYEHVSDDGACDVICE